MATEKDNIVAAHVVPVDFYGFALSIAMKKMLFEIDQQLSGRADKAAYRLNDAQYAQARDAIAALYRVVSRPQLVVSAIGRSRADAPFQSFLQQVTTG